MGKLSKTKDKVLQIMRMNDEARNCDITLSYFYWGQELPGSEQLGKITAKRLLIKLREGKLTSMEAIGRARRWVQEHHPELQATKAAVRERRRQRQKQVRQEVLDLKSGKL